MAMKIDTTWYLYQQVLLITVFVCSFQKFNVHVILVKVISRSFSKIEHGRTIFQTFPGVIFTPLTKGVYQNIINKIRSKNLFKPNPLKKHKHTQHRTATNFQLTCNTVQFQVHQSRHERSIPSTTTSNINQIILLTVAQVKVAQ